MAIKTEAELEAQVTADMPNNGKIKAAKVVSIFQNIIDTLFYWVGSLSTSISDLTTLVNGKASNSHTHAGSDITSGTVAVTRLGTGTPNSLNFLRGDGTFAIVPGSDGGSLVSGDIIDEAFIVASPPAVRAGFLACNGQSVDGNVIANTALRTKLGSQFITNVEINRPPAEPSVVLTSNSQAGYICSASTTLASFPAYLAFDATGTDWISELWSNITTPATVGGDWVKIQLPSAMKFESMNWTAGVGVNFSFQASNDNSTWVTLGTVSNLSGSTITIADATPYLYYRFLITTLVSGQNRAQMRNATFRSPLISPIRYFQTPNLSNPSTGIRRIIKL